MSGILRIESLTKGNTLKQGDKTPLKYRLLDADGEELNIAGKSAVARLMYPDFLRAGYESETLTVSPDNTVTFSIDKVIKPVLYYVEITVDDKYIFPSRVDESKINIDKSSKGSDVAIIEIIGKDILIRDVREQVETEIKPVVDDMIIANQKVLENEKIVQDVNSLAQQLENRQNQVEQFNNQVITEMTDKDVISAPEIIEARDGFDTLGDRLNDTVMQSAHNVSSIVDIKKVYGATGNGVDSDVQPLLNAFNDDVQILGFPNGVYVIDQHILVENRNITFVSLGDNVVFIDKGKNILLESNETVNTPVGIRFENSKTNFINFIFDNDVFSGGLVNPQEKQNVVPQFDFYQCEVYLENPKTKGRTPPHIGSLSENSALDVMRSSFMRFHRCESVEIKKPHLLDGAGGGEIFVFLETNNIKFLDSQHSTLTSDNTFWSLVKMIKCSNVQINGSAIRSWSSGSYIDVTGDNILLENIHINYANGKLLDVSSEWGSEGGDIGTVVVKNSSTNGFGIFNSSSDLGYTTEIEKIIIENLDINVPLPRAQAQDYWGIHPTYTKNVYARDVSMHNVRYILYYYSSDINTHTKKNAVIENLVITKDETLNSTHQIEGHGYLRVDNIQHKSSGTLSFVDRYIIKTGLKASEVQSEIIIENSNFNNIHMTLSGNVKFINCTFNNVRFGNAIPIENSTISFVDSEFNFISTNDSITGAGRIFDFDSSLNYRLVLDNSTIRGETFNTSTLALFSQVDTYLKNSNISLDRIKTGGVKDVYTLYTPSTGKNITVDNTVFKDNTRILPSIATTYDEVFISLKNSTIEYNVGMSFDNVDNMNLTLINNLVKEDGTNNLGSRFETSRSQFKKLVEGNNIEY